MTNKTRKIFKHGNSLVVTVPSEAGIKPGTKLNFLGRTKNSLQWQIVEE